MKIIINSSRHIKENDKKWIIIDDLFLKTGEMSGGLEIEYSGPSENELYKRFKYLNNGQKSVLLGLTLNRATSSEIIEGLERFLELERNDNEKLNKIIMEATLIDEETLFDQFFEDIEILVENI